MKYTSRQTAYLVLEDETVYQGYAVGTIGTTTGEICFNTGMTGYQEIYTDPSYYGQIIINTASHIGNYGVLEDDEDESRQVQFAGLVCKDFASLASRYKSTDSLQAYFEKHGIVGISDIDTRELVLKIRDAGAMNAIISSEIVDVDELKKKVKEIPSMSGLELSTKVTTTEVYELGDKNATHKVAVLDLGIKKSILHHLTTRDCLCKVFPAKTSFEEMKKWNPDAFFISNGPGDPFATSYAIDTVKQILEEDYPMFGICLGHQIISLANGVGTFKMHQGHRGLNHPVKNLNTGLCEVTSQNHGFAVNKEEVEKSDNVELSHINLNDGVVAGIRIKGKNAFSVQFHPESSPGPHDSRYLFDEFVNLISENKSQLVS
ncbi:MAG: glutamine-hydrolyzing carbamoyl-phosphate synthase small subunit [Cyclobacteriaceae bacterium]